MLNTLHEKFLKLFLRTTLTNTNYQLSILKKASRSALMKYVIKSQMYVSTASCADVHL